MTPRPQPPEPTVQILIRVTASLRERIRLAAAHSGKPMSVWILNAINKQLDRDERRPR